MDTFSFRTLQQEHAPWVKHNFGDRPSWMPLLGIVEEIGELHESKSETDMLDAVADIVIFMSDFCTAMGFDLEALYTTAQLDDGSDNKNRALATNAGRLCHSYLKLAQGIRGTKEEHDAAMREALVGILWNIDARLHIRGESLRAVTYATWQMVRQRDWKKNATTGGERAEPG